MMLFKPLALFTALAALAVADSVPDHTAYDMPETVDELGRRNVAGVYGCNKANWEGGCWWQQADGGRFQSYPLEFMRT
jgi:hypothetical protein